MMIEAYYQACASFNEKDLNIWDLRDKRVVPNRSIAEAAKVVSVIGRLPIYLKRQVA